VCLTASQQLSRPWNKGLLVGKKRPLLPWQVWSIRVRLEMAASTRDVALFNLAIESKLRACDLVCLKVEDICSGQVVRERGTVTQRKTGRPVQFEITEVTRQSVERFLSARVANDGGYLFPSRSRTRPHISTRQYARIVHRWIRSIGLDDRGFGTHSLRRTKVTQIYRKTGNLRAVQLLLGHAKIETTVRLSWSGGGRRASAGRANRTVSLGAGSSGGSAPKGDASSTMNGART